MTVINFRAKKAKEKWKSMVSYETGKSRFGEDEYDDREPGLGHERYLKYCMKLKIGNQLFCNFVFKQKYVYY